MPHSRIRYIIFIIAAILQFFITGCSSTGNEYPSPFLFYDFESDKELDWLHWKCKTLMSLSDRHVSHGSKSLKLELFPSDYPGFNPALKNIDWNNYSKLCFEIYNPEKSEQRLCIRIDDRVDNPEYNDRYNSSVILKRGMNYIEIELDSIITSGTERKLEIQNITKLLLFMVNPPEKITLYLDYLRLV